MIKIRFFFQKASLMLQKIDSDYIVYVVTRKYSGTRLGGSLGQHMFQIRSRNLALLAQVSGGVVLAYI